MAAVLHMRYIVFHSFSKTKLLQCYMVGASYTSGSGRTRRPTDVPVLPGNAW